MHAVGRLTQPATPFDGDADDGTLRRKIDEFSHVLTQQMRWVLVRPIFDLWKQRVRMAKDQEEIDWLMACIFTPQWDRSEVVQGMMRNQLRMIYDMGWPTRRP